MKRILSLSTGALMSICLLCPLVVAQTTAFTYQGSINTSGSPASGNHDFEFAMFNGGGVQIGATLTRLNVPVTGGVFAVELDFGNQFQGADRLLEIRVRPSGGGSFTTLAPRQLITSAPHAIRSLDAAQLGGVAANQYILSGAASINAATQYNLNGFRILSVGTGSSNLFVGISAGNSNTGGFNTFVGSLAGFANTTGVSNTFVGSNSGNANTTGKDNAFFGSSSGRLNTTGDDNAFFGAFSAISNTSGSRNAFFGQASGANNTIGNNNSFFGNNTGASNTIGTNNSFFGISSGRANTEASLNSFFGSLAGENTTTGGLNAFFGADSGNSNITGTQNSFFGARSGISNTIGSNNSFFGHDSGRNNTTASGNAFFGSASGRANTSGTNNAFFGRDAGLANTIGGSNVFVGSAAGAGNTTGFGNSFFGSNAGTATTTASDNSFFGRSAGSSNSTGANNSYFGANAGILGTIGQNNAFFGFNSGFDNTTGSNNSFFGSTAGDNNTTGTANSFFGFSAGDGNTTGSGNSYFGANSNSSDGLTNASAIGSRAFVTQSNSVILGSINGTNGATADTNVGIGTTAPARRLHVASGSSGATSLASSDFVIEDDAAAFQHFITPNDVESGILFGDPTDSIAGGIVFNNAATNNGMLFRAGGNTTRMTLNGSGKLGIGVNPADALDVNGIIRVATLGSAGGTPLCRNASNQIATCSSAMRYQSNAKGGTEGVEYDGVGVLLVNAVKEQQVEIESQRKEIDDLRGQVDALKKLICATNESSEICAKETRKEK